MTKGDSISTINKILMVAEELFSEKGFNGASVNMIAEKAGVNKALIYYHFKDKNDIINSMFKSMIKESGEFVRLSSEPETTEKFCVHDKIRKEIEFMLKRKKILSVMLMESLKGDDKEYYLFKCFENVFNNELDHIAEMDMNKEEYSSEVQRFLVHEFFTGFIPIFSLVVFMDKWCEYFNCDPELLMSNFLESFNKSHLVTKESLGSEK